MTYNVRNIVIALVLAAVAAFLVIMYTGNVQKQAHNSQQTTTVLVATADIPAGTTAQDAISGGQLKPSGRGDARRDRGALTDSRSTERWYATQQILLRSAGHRRDVRTFGRDTAGHADQAATTAPSRSASPRTRLLGGTLEAGDHVDMVGTYTVHPSNGGSGLRRQPHHRA